MTALPLGDPGTHAAYTGRTTSWPVVAASSIGGLALLVLASASASPHADLALLLVLAGLGVVAELATASSVRASAGTNGLAVRWGLAGWPRCSYALDQIARAEVIDLPWWRVSLGFWWTPRTTSCTVRSGPTVRLVLTSGRRVTVTVPEPAAAVTAIDDAMRARRGA